MKILICEDNPLIAVMLEDLVADLGHTACGVAMEMREALELLTAERPDFALVDLDLLDGRTGFDIVERFADAGVPAAIVSGHSSVMRPDGSRAVALLTKPVHERRLAETLAAAVAD